MKFFQELKRRNMFRVAGAYAVVGWLLVQMIVAVKGPLRLPVWTDTFVILLVLAGFPIALILAWAFELTPDGVRPTRSVDPAESITAQTGRKLDFAIVGSLALVALLIVATWALPGKPQVAMARTVTDKSIAVLPFNNRSTNPDDAFFAEGIHDDLLTQLSKVSALRVISRTSVMQYAESEKAVPEIAQELGVAVILEGAVQRAGNRVRINVQLINGTNDEHVWAESYDREMSVENLLEIQSDITSTIATALQAVMTGDEKAAVGAVPTHSTAAYEAFLKAKLIYANDQRDPGNLQAAIDAFDEAVHLDPNFAEAYAHKATAHLAMVWWGYDAPRNLALAETALARARAAAPDSIETRIAEAVYEYCGRTDYKAARDALLPLLKEAPNNSDILNQIGLAERRIGNLKASNEYLEKAIQLSPADVNILATLSANYHMTGEWKKGQEVIQRALELAPDSAYVRQSEYSLLLDRADLNAAWAWYEDLRSSGQIDRETTDSLFLLYMGNFLSDPQMLEIANQRIAAMGSDDNAVLSGITMIRALVLQRLGREAEARILIDDALARAAKMNPIPTEQDDVLFIRMYANALLNDRDGAVAGAEGMMELAKNDKVNTLLVGRDVASVYAMVGEKDRALSLLKMLMKEGGPNAYCYVLLDPAFAPFRQDPAFLKLKAEYDAWCRSQGIPVRS